MPDLSPDQLRQALAYKRHEGQSFEAMPLTAQRAANAWLAAITLSHSQYRELYNHV